MQTTPVTSNFHTQPKLSHEICKLQPFYQRVQHGEIAELRFPQFRTTEARKQSLQPSTVSYTKM